MGQMIRISGILLFFGRKKKRLIRFRRMSRFLYILSQILQSCALYRKILSRADPPRSVAPEGLNGVEIGRLDRREKAEHNADAHGKHHGDEDRRDADGRRRAHDG